MAWLLLCIFGLFIQQSFTEETCDSDIYCYGNLLKTIQSAKIYKDSKYFVDMSMRWEPEQIKSEFDKLMRKTHNSPSKEKLKKFVEDHFSDPGYDSEMVKPTGWKDDPAFLQNITNKDLRAWAAHLNKFWKKLTLKVKDKVKTNPNRYSLIWVPNPVVVPGDRFREYYYWDMYYTMKGLLKSEMGRMVKGMLENFFYLVKKYNFVPNGGRVYYTRRSQPPYLIPMMKLYMDYSKDTAFLRDNIDTLEEEYNFWQNHRNIDVHRPNGIFKMFRYDVNVDGPRPESYHEDVVTASVKENDMDKQDIYRHLKSAAESGWDFSSRWFLKDGTNKGNLSDIGTRFIIPVDLNSLMCYNARILADFYRQLNQNAKGKEYDEDADLIDKAINKVMWDDQKGAWLDYDIKNEKLRPYFYMSNIHPLWTKCYQSVKNKEEVERKVFNYIKESDALDYTYSIPTSLRNTSQQWDYPNSWAPLQDILIEALKNLKTSEADDLAFNVAQQWIATNYKAYTKCGHMYEKYNAVTGKGGSGGEYNVQLGFGWTNGVALDLLGDYGDRLTTESPITDAATSNSLFSLLLCGSVLISLSKWNI